MTKTTKYILKLVQSAIVITVFIFSGCSNPTQVTKNQVSSDKVTSTSDVIINIGLPAYQSARGVSFGTDSSVNSVQVTSLYNNAQDGSGTLTSLGGSGYSGKITVTNTGAHTFNVYALNAASPAQELWFGSQSINITGSGDTLTVPMVTFIPAGLSATSTSSTSVGLSWGSVNGATSYNIYRSTTSGALGSKINTSTITSSSYTDTGLTTGTTYYYEVTAVNSVGESTGGTQVSAVPTVPASVTVTYNANGATSGTAPSDTNTYSAGASVTVMNNTGSLSYSGYSFAGWNTAANGSGSTYTPGQQFIISASTTLYAVWTTSPVYTISFNANGGSGSMSSINLTQGSSTYLPANTFTYSGFTFAGWATSSTGSVIYNDQQGLTPTSNLTLYAIWSASSSLIAYYNFSNQDCSDSSGKGNNGTAYNVSYVSNGNGGYAASFNGTSSYIDLPSGLINGNSSAFTIMITFKTTQNGAFLGYQSWSASGFYFLTGGVYTPLLAIETNGKLRGEEYMGTQVAIESSTVVNDGNWHTVYLTATSNSLSMKLDGVNLGTQTGTVSYFAAQTNNQLGAANCLGRPTTVSYNATTGWGLYNGLIGKFAMFNSALN